MANVEPRTGQIFLHKHKEHVLKAGDTMTGALTILPLVDTTSIFRVLNAANTVNVLLVDSTNQRVGIGRFSPNSRLHIVNAAAVNGTGTITTIARAVTGTSTIFNTELSVGDTITAVNGAGTTESRQVTVVTNDTSASIDNQFTTDISSATSFTIKKGIARFFDSTNQFTAGVAISAEGKIGILTNPIVSDGLRMDRTTTESAPNNSLRQTGCSYILRIGPTVTPSINMTYIGGFFICQTNTGATDYSAAGVSLYGLEGQARHQGTGTLTSLNGLLFAVDNPGDGTTAGTVTTMVGCTVSSTNDNRTNAITTTLVGYSTSVQNQAAQTVATMIGYRVSSGGPTNAGGSVTEFDEFLSVSPFATGTITTMIGYKVNNLGAANITNSYGLYIASQSGAATASYAIYSLGGQSIHGGKFSIGSTTNPTAQLYLGAGSSAANTAPVQFNSGTLETTARAGLVEYNGKHYVTNAGIIRYPLGGTLFDNFADANSSSTNGTFDDLYSATLAANTFNGNGDKVTARYSGTFVANGTATRELKVLFAGTTILDTGALTTATADSWDITVMIIQESSTVVRCVATVIASTTLGAQAFNDTTYTRITGLTLSGTNILKIQGAAAGVGAAAADIVAKMATLAYVPAA